MLLVLVEAAVLLLLGRLYIGDSRGVELSR